MNDPNHPAIAELRRQMRAGDEHRGEMTDGCADKIEALLRDGIEMDDLGHLEPWWSEVWTVMAALCGGLLLMAIAAWVARLIIG